ncbi:hypothetical protein [Paraflavitalea sp. CAU 1676]|uniref:hypothetical protein n=1 Tax=Paraflavitalea sp. CAU 1676 TaxID=3032598 RepID=UPI0023D9B057|nr:hypothetical protein [Paraflavitalea sp. CAU 1676]MDF2191168.1 hypothetical protein [Paraflavitalea sp. CAU 1676]
MDLDNLKEIWKDLDEKDFQPTNKGGIGPAVTSHEEEIAAILRKRSQSPIAKIKRNLGWELGVIIALYSVTMYYYITAWQGRYWEIALLLGVIGASFVVYYFRKNRLLKEMQLVESQVKVNLEKRLSTLEKYVRFYFVSGTVLTPAAYFVAGLIVFFKSPPRATEEKMPAMMAHITGHDYFVLFTVSGVALAIGSYFLNIWYVNKLYGRHINKLKNLLNQMEEEA